MSPERAGESNFSEVEMPPVLPFFIVMDVSLSMKPVIEEVNSCFKELQKVIHDDGTVEEVCRIGVVSFAETVRSELGLANLGYADVPRLTERDSRTNFRPVIQHLRGEIEDSIRRLGRGAEWHRPVVFFITDGFHNASEDDWRGPLGALKDPGWKYRPEIVAVGFGDADQDQIREVSTTWALMVKASLDFAEQIREIFKFLIGTVYRNSQDAANLDGGDALELHLEPDSQKMVMLHVNTND